MNNNIQKINLIHSVVFFLLTIFFSLLIDQNQNLKISPVICLFLILSIGISHGSLDNLKGRKLLSILNINYQSLFYLTYIIIGLAIIFIWLIFPTLTLVLFLITASYHFGKEDTDFLVNKNKSLDELFYFFKGLLIIIAPLLFHFDDAINIFKLLLVENEIFYIFIDFVESSKSILLIFLLSIIGHIYFCIKKLNILSLILYFDFFSILILNYFLTPLIAFTLYFCFLHSLRHSISLAVELNPNNLKSGFCIFMKKALPLTIVTTILFIFSLFILSKYYVLNDAILKVIFIGLASLTFPHILLEYLIEKNEQK